MRQISSKIACLVTIHLNNVRWVVRFDGSVSTGTGNWIGFPTISVCRVLSNKILGGNTVQWRGVRGYMHAPSSTTTPAQHHKRVCVGREGVIRYSG
jgi:hypothetical protein